jgi:lipopolysaccharide export system protein LptA
MRDEYEIKNLEVVLNGNLIIAKDKLKNYKTIFGVKVSYQLLEENMGANSQYVYMHKHIEKEEI